MDSVRKAKDRLSKYPLLVAKCSSSASAYAICVTSGDLNVKKGACEKEFQQFKQCLLEQAKNMKTKL